MRYTMTASLFVPPQRRLSKNVIETTTAVQMYVCQEEIVDQYRVARLITKNNKQREGESVQQESVSFSVAPDHNKTFLSKQVYLKRDLIPQSQL